MLTIAFSPNIGGVETHLDDLCKYLTKQNHELYVITYKPITTNVESKSLEERKRMKIYRLPLFGRGLFHKIERNTILQFLYLTPILLFGSILFMLMHRSKIDVVHAHGLNAAFIGKFLNKIYSKRYVVSIHTIYDLTQRSGFARLVKKVLSEADSILLPSRRSERDFLGAGMSFNKLKICPEWVDLDTYKPLDKSACRKDLKLKEGFIILFVGRLIEKKGVKVLLNTALDKSHSESTFVFVGDGPLSKDLSEKAISHDNITFAGKVSEDLLVKYYNAADVVVVPSLYDEIFGRTTVESISCGTPVIAPNTGAIPELLNSSVSRLINIRKQLSSELEALRSNPNSIISLSKNCRLYAEEHFSERNATKIERSYYSDDYDNLTV